MLHNNKELFEQIVLNAAAFLKIEPAIIEKDYYVTLFLKEMVKIRPDIVFKGGTSLSKCYGVIKRFSEDIDLNLAGETKPTEGQRRKLKNDIETVVNRLNFRIINAEDIFSKRDFNRYIIKYPVTLAASYLKSQIIVETAVFFRTYPDVTLDATNYIYDYLKETGHLELAAEYTLEPFKIIAQSAERTMIDKLYALGDYYLSGEITEHSRHIYDIYKLSDIVTVNDELRKLAADVRKERQTHKTCLSAQEGINLNKLLLELLDNEAFKADYESITESLLFEDVDYDTAAKGIKRVLQNKLF